MCSRRVHRLRGSIRRHITAHSVRSSWFRGRDARCDAHSTAHDDYDAASGSGHSGSDCANDALSDDVEADSRSDCFGEDALSKFLCPDTGAVTVCPASGYPLTHCPCCSSAHSEAHCSHSGPSYKGSFDDAHSPHSRSNDADTGPGDHSCADYSD